MVSFAVTVTAVAGAAAWVVPEMTPLEALMLNPGGSPVAAQCKEGLGLVSVACTVRETAVLDLVVWLPGFVTVTALIVQVNDALPLPPLVSPAVTVTEEVPPVVGVPVMAALVAPVEAMPSPAGSPDADQLHAQAAGVRCAEAQVHRGALGSCPGFPDRTTAIVFDGTPVTMGCDSSQPPAPPLKSLAHVDCTAKAPVPRVRSVAGALARADPRALVPVLVTRRCRSTRRPGTGP